MQNKEMTQQETDTRIKSCKEAEKEVQITMDEIKAEEVSDDTTTQVSKAEIKAALDTLNPDEASMESRG